MQKKSLNEGVRKEINYFEPCSNARDKAFARAQMGTTQSQLCFIWGIWARFGIIYVLNNVDSTPQCWNNVDSTLILRQELNRRLFPVVYWRWINVKIDVVSSVERSDNTCNTNICPLNVFRRYCSQIQWHTTVFQLLELWFVCLMFNCPVNTIKVMSSRSVGPD